MPYLSYAIRPTHVSNLQLIGRLFGMQPPDCRRSRVLEIGGASGGNLLPMAVALPDSEFLCLDPSVRQIEEGRRHAAALGLKNLRFDARSIEALGRKVQFDYIICHGVFSWVRPAVQDAILKALQNCLAANGIAFVSYKTLPGWHAHRALREVLLRHCARDPRPGTTAARARQMLQLLEKAAQDPRSHWGPHLVAEIRDLQASADEFLLHDQLEEYTEAFYFGDFMARAHAHGLQYLGDADLQTMYIGNVPPGIPPDVAMGDDVEAIEQYTDFALNRLFRQTLLCRDSVGLNRMLAREAVDSCYVQSLLAPQSRDTFRSPGGTTLTTADPVAQEILLALARHGAFPVSAQTVIAELCASMPDPEAVQATFRRMVLQTFFAGALQLYSLPPAYVAAPSARPRALPWARYEATYRPAVTNGRHETMQLSDFDRALFLKLDGTRDVADLARELGNEVQPALERLAQATLLCA